jgi:hypothetical protein
MSSTTSVKESLTEVSKADRRDHKPAPSISYRPRLDGRGGTIVGDVTCGVCGERISHVYNRNLSVKSRSHWRHIRRPK